MTNNATLYMYISVIFGSAIMCILMTHSKIYHKEKKTIFLFKSASWSVSHKKVWMLLLSVLPMMMLACLRMDTGADYEQYTWNFARLVSTSDKWNYVITSREPMYSLTQYLSYSIFGNNYFWWFAIMAISTFAIIVGALVKIDRFMDMPMYVILFGMCVYLHMFNYVRQMFAAALVLFAIAYCMEYKIVRFIICVILASMMHQSSIVFLMIPILYWKKEIFKGISYHAIMIISPFFLSGIVFVLSHIPYFSLYFIRYFGASFDLGIGWIIDVLPVICMYYMCGDRNEIKNDVKSINADFLLELGWIIIPIRALAYYSYAAGRLFINFSMIAMVGVAIKICSAKNSVAKRIILVLLMFIYFIYTFYIGNNSEVFPYQSFLK